MKEEVTKEQMEFFKLALNKVRSMTQNIDSQTDIIIGISTAVLIYSVSKIDTSQSTFYFLLALFSGISTLIGLIAIHPFKFLRKRGGGDESMTYNKKVTSFSSPGEYAEALGEFLKDPKNVAQDCAFDIYNTYKHYYQPKRKMYAWARNMLILGVALALLFLILKYAISLIAK